MARLFPFRNDETEGSGEPRLVDIDDEAADEVFAALSSDTARAILSRLYEDPETASGVAESANTSIQNARYHLEKLETAGLIEPVDTWYSSRGTEMTVYAPTGEPLVVAAGDQESKGVLRRALQRVIGGVGVLGLASVVINRLADRSSVSPGNPDGLDSADTTGTPAETGGSEGGSTVDTNVAATEPPRDGGTQVASDTGVQAPADVNPTRTDAPATGTSADPVNGSPAPTETPMGTVTDATRTVADGAADSVLTVPPGALFFAGGAVVIAVTTVWWYWREYRPIHGA